ncbi:DNA repair protein RecO C-terminal domain-containing protein, partial [Candidatus Sumerlaeota bacterium]|nr:DNA repair protein RecO C-terminal domain-containing protein [Candidatus Sumerlaeota bacterium]
VCRYLKDMDKSDRPIEQTLRALVAMLACFGFCPQFDRCGVCGGEGPFRGFRLDLCSAVCQRCAGGQHYRRLPPGTIEAFKFLAGTDAAGEMLRLSETQADQILLLVIGLLQYHLEISLSTVKMLITGEMTGR